MMKSTNTKGFTLVELIIVITILAILATIAFISFQGYSKEARNSKRASDLNSIVRAIEIKTGADGVTIMNFASGVTTSQLTTPALSGTSAIVWTDYQAGDVNFTALGNVDNTSFKDPLSGTYKIWVTSLAGGAYQLAASKEEEGGKTAYVVGTYKARTNADTASGTVNGTTLTLSTGLGLFKKWDYITSGSSEVSKVVSVSSDLSRLTLEAGGTLTSSATIALNWAGEVSGLINSVWGTTAADAVANGWSKLPY